MYVHYTNICANILARFVLCHALVINTCYHSSSPALPHSNSIEDNRQTNKDEKIIALFACPFNSADLVTLN